MDAVIEEQEVKTVIDFKPAPTVIDLTKAVSNRDQLTEQVENAVIKNDDDLENATALLKMVKVAIAKADDQRKEGGKWFYNMYKQVNEKYKPITDKLEALKETLEGKIKPYELKKLKAKEEEDAKQKAELEATALEQAGEAEQQGDLELANEIVTTAAAASDRLTKPRTIRSFHGSVTTSKIVKDFEVEDIHLLLQWIINNYENPLELLEIRHAPIKKLVNDGVTLDGIKIVDDVKLSSR